MKEHRTKALRRAPAVIVLAALGFGCSASGKNEDNTPSGSGATGSGATSGSGASPGSGAAPGSGAGSGTGPMLGGDGPPVDPAEDEDCGKVLPVVYRDFTEAHPDFECCNSGYGVTQGLVMATLGPERKPIFKSSIGDCVQSSPSTPSSPAVCDPKNYEQRPPIIKDAASFATWYVTTPGVNVEVSKTLTLTETPAGSGAFVFESDAFFPIEPAEGSGPSPAGQTKDYLFTTEIHLLFGYAAGQKFTFNGDDDVWIFVNGKLALDLGGLHGKADGVIDFDAKKEELGIVPGRTYNMDVFHAERHTSASNFRIQTNITCFKPGPIVN